MNDFTATLTHLEDGHPVTARAIFTDERGKVFDLPVMRVGDGYQVGDKVKFRYQWNGAGYSFLPSGKAEIRKVLDEADYIEALCNTGATR
jgi:hypothetical protein